VVVGAVMLDDKKFEQPGDTVLITSWYDELNDSKKLSPKKREKLAREIKIHAGGVGIGWVSNRTIDRIGISASLKLATRRAVAQLAAEIGDDYDQVIIDGTVNFLPDNPKATTMIKADGRIKAVAAASIVAKVARDEYMKNLDPIFPKYGFAGHKGYGTAKHLAAIKKFGPSPLHRVSFAPMNGQGAARKTAKIDRTIGRRAEHAAAEWLIARGHELVAQNWRTNIAEIDIMTAKDDRLYFHEVKYRRNDAAGDGVAAITCDKLNQMKKAVKLWYKIHPRDAREPVLTAVAMSGEPPTVTDYLEIV
jgi:ribonuclease HII